MNDDKQSRERNAELREEGFLGRWSRRKQDAREGRAVDVPIPTETASSEPVSEAPLPIEQEGEAPKTDEDMPPIESLGEHSDYIQFLSPGVSQELRRAALRKLFHLPRYNFRDGLDDYALDYTKFKPLGNIITSDMRFQLERMAEKFGRKLEDLIEEVKTTGEMPDFSSQRKIAAADESREPSAASNPGATDPDPKTPS